MLENNRDRGRIKWTAMMLTEHVEKLREWMDEDNYVERPALDEFDMQLIQEEIELAYKRKCQALIKTWKNGKVEKQQGIIDEIDLRLMVIVLVDSFEKDRISVSDIIGIQCVN